MSTVHELLARLGTTGALAAWLSGATIFAFLVYLAIAIYVWRWPQQQIDAMARLYEEDEPCKREKP
jgi:hypothetical protein